MSIDLSIVVCVYNEEPRNLWIMLDRLRAAITPSGLSYEVVFVDDGSRAETNKALREVAARTDYVKLVILSRNFGQQAAITAGIDHCDGQAVINIDSDLQDPPEMIPDMVRLWRDGYDVVYAQRNTRRDRLAKKLSAYLFYRLLGLVSTVRMPLDTGDFRLMDRKVVDALAALPEKTRFLRGLVPWLGFKQIGISIERDARSAGESGYTLRKLLALAFDGILSFSVAPLYVVLLLGGSLFGLGVVGLLAWLLCGSASGAQGGLVAAVIAMLALTGLQIACVGLVAIYLSKTLEEVRARPTYIVAERAGAPFAAPDRPAQAARRRPALAERGQEDR